MCPFCRVLDNTGPHHIPVNVYQAPKEMFARCNSSGMITILPKSAFALFTLIVFLGCPSSDELQAFGYEVLACVFYPKFLS
jgi:hypothetical protein